MITTSPYPESAVGRSRWIVERRGPREKVDPEQPSAFLVEKERFANGEIGDVATIFLTNRECPWRCAMCDLWKHTLPQSVEPGAIPRQIAYALERMPSARQIKLYNSGSFFDPRAIAPQDYLPISAMVSGFDRVIVESHPALIGCNCFDFEQLVGGRLEVAMGLETAHPEVLAKLNKRMTLEQYGASAELLRAHGVALRTFILVQPPFLNPAEAFYWACRSMDFAVGCRATAITLIPTRAGNGAMDELARIGQFTPPSLAMLEDCMEYGLSLASGRVFVDLWDTARVECCAFCREGRLQRLRSMNLSQVIMERVPCQRCGANR